MKESTQKALNTIGEAHDWEEGQTYSNGGTEYHSTDTCRMCGLRRHWRDDSQNGINDQIRFSDGETGEDLSVRQALNRDCA